MPGVEERRKSSEFNSLNNDDVIITDTRFAGIRTRTDFCLNPPHFEFLTRRRSHGNFELKVFSVKVANVW